MATSTHFDRLATANAQEGENDVRQKEIEAVRNLAIRDKIRMYCREKLMGCAQNKGTAFSVLAAHEVLAAFSEESLAQARVDEATKMKWAEGTGGQEGWENVVNRYLDEANRYGEKVLRLLQEARDHNPPAISLENMTEWQHRMKDGSWKSTKEFIDKKFEGRVKNWKKIAAERKKLLDDPRIEAVRNSGLLTKGELEDFLSGTKFLNQHYDRRVHLVELIKAAMTKVKGGTSADKLKKEAKAKLEKAVKAGILAPNKVGHWMKRIFSEEHSVETIKNFLSGKGSFPLSTLIQNWTEVKGRFDNLQSLRKNKGTPQSFHFVSKDVFLNWDFDRRESYVEEAEHRFEDIEKEPELFLKIRHELDTKDWEAAEEMLEEAGERTWSVEDEQKLTSLKRFLREHRPKEDEQDAEVKEQSPSPDEIVEDMREALNMIPFPHIRDRFIHAMNYDYQTLWALCTMQYNWEWCRLHGYSSDEIDHSLRHTAKQETYIAQEQGGAHRGHVNLDATTDTSVKVFRDDNDTRSAQAIHVDESTDNGQLIHKIHQNKDNRAVWYWTRIMEKNVPYSFFQYMIHNIQPRIKSGMRKLDRMGYKFTEHGPARKKDGTVNYAAAEPAEKH